MGQIIQEWTKSVFHKFYFVCSWILCPIYIFNYSAVKSALVSRPKIYLFQHFLKTILTWRRSSVFVVNFQHVIAGWEVMDVSWYILIWRYRYSKNREVITSPVFFILTFSTPLLPCFTQFVNLVIKMSVSMSTFINSFLR